jgi:hypothetical protein
MLLMCSAVLPTLVSVVVLCEVQKQCPKKGIQKHPKDREVGLSSTSVLVPLRETVCGLVGVLSAIAKVAIRAPTCVGRKATLIVQLAPTARAPTIVGVGKVLRVSARDRYTG